MTFRKGSPDNSAQMGSPYYRVDRLRQGSERQAFLTFGCVGKVILTDLSGAFAFDTLQPVLPLTVEDVSNHLEPSFALLQGRRKPAQGNLLSQGIYRINFLQL